MTWLIVLLLAVGVIGLLWLEAAYKNNRFYARVYRVLESGSTQKSKVEFVTDYFSSMGKVLVGRLLSSTDQIFLLDKLRSAGFTDPAALPIFMILKLLSYVVTLLVFIAFNHDFSQWDFTKVGIVIVLFAFAGVVTEKILDELIYRRQQKIKKSIPEAIDLLVICLESGLSLDDAIAKVAEKIEHTFPELAKEFDLLHTELQVLPDRKIALENLVKRSNLDDKLICW